MPRFSQSRIAAFAAAGLLLIGGRRVGANR